MPVVGKGAQVEFRGRTADANAINPKYSTSQLLIVDDVIQYDCPQSGKTYILFIKTYSECSRDELFNEVGLKVHDVPKIHIDDPSRSDHLLEFPETKSRYHCFCLGCFLFCQHPSPLLKCLRIVRRIMS